MESPTPTYKIVLLGDGGVGKTTWVNNILTGEFRKKYIATIGADINTISFDTNYGKKNLEIWDVAGQEKFSGLRDEYFLDSHGAIIFYDITSNISIKNLEKWLIAFIQVAPEKPIIIVANKLDVENSAKYTHIINQMRKHLDQKIMSCSVKNRLGVKPIVKEILKSVSGKSDLDIND